MRKKTGSYGAIGAICVSGRYSGTIGTKYGGVGEHGANTGHDPALLLAAVGTGGVGLTSKHIVDKSKNQPGVVGDTQGYQQNAHHASSNHTLLASGGHSLAPIGAPNKCVGV